VSKDNTTLDTLANLLTQQNRLLEANNKHLTTIERKLNEQGAMLEVLGRAELRDLLADVDHNIQRRQMSMLETMQRVADGYSLARWGDGEVKLMLQPEFDLMFQKANPDLSNDLAQLLENYDSISTTTMLALPTLFTSRLWQGIWAENWHLMKPILQKSLSRFANTHVSRPLFFSRHRDEAVAAWRKVWEQKRICVVAGKGSKFDPIPQLFDNAADLMRVDSLPANAYSDIPRLQTVLGRINDVDVYLIALGPAGTLLAAWLASPQGGNKHAIDAGHLASSYLHVFEDAAMPERLPLIRKA